MLKNCLKRVFFQCFHLPRPYQTLHGQPESTVQSLIGLRMNGSTTPSSGEVTEQHDALLRTGSSSASEHHSVFSPSLINHWGRQNNLTSSSVVKHPNLWRLDYCSFPLVSRRDRCISVPDTDSAQLSYLLDNQRIHGNLGYI